MTEENKLTAKSRFMQLHSKRQEVIRRAEAAAKVTIPSIFPPQPHKNNARLRTPYDGLGARAVNHLSSKLVLALFPPNTAFFRLSLEEEVNDALEADGLDLEEIREKLAKIERKTISRMEKDKLRSYLALTTAHLLVTGNALLDTSKDGIRFFPLHQYVVERDNSGNVVELIIVERVHPETLDDSVLQSCNIDTKKAAEDPDGIEVYTVVTLQNKKYEYRQEINGFQVPGSEGSYKSSSPRFIPLRWRIIAGEDYGRGLVDEHIGDFNALDSLSRDILKGSSAAAKVIFLTRPGSLVRPSDLAKAESGDVLQGQEGDVSTIQLQKFADFRVVFERLEAIKSSISAAFLMNSSIQRHAERVTAEEIRTMAQELEDALGGVYSLLSQELQAPLVRRYIDLMVKANEIPRLPEDQINLIITTGLDALGRGHELNKVIGAIRALAEVFGQEQVAQRLNFEDVATRFFTGFGVDQKGLIKTQEQLAADQQQGLMGGIAQDAIPGMLQEAMKGQQQNG